MAKLTHEEISRKGGKARSARKTRAARKNWKKARAAIGANGPKLSDRSPEARS